MPEVSVLLPVYNAESFLAEAVESLVSQTFEDFEILAVDDGSDDSSCDILERVCDPRIRIVRRPHEGLISTLNFGLGEARGKWIARMDADDVALPNRLQKQWDYLCDHKEIVVLGGAAEIIDADGRRTGTIVTPTSEHNQLVASLTARGRGRHLIHPSVVMRKDAAIRCGGYREQFPICEDSDMWMRLSEVGRLHSIPDIVLLLRKHSGNISTIRSRTQLESSIAALACHFVRQQANMDPIDSAPDQWRKITSQIPELVDRYHMMTRREMAVRKKKGGLSGLLSVLGWLVTHPTSWPKLRNHDRGRRKVAQSIATEIILAVSDCNTPSAPPNL